ncbi:MAG: hypothetical protein KatS3mg088_473 [Patescibacteria group bacterium]|jgi:hypothetical protein|nr:MAG: hypothetical protein KatS3mg088_473 [Patescibacteria group bacterium]
MELKKSLKADAVANLYRASIYFAKGNEKMGNFFVSRASKFIDLGSLRRQISYLRDNKIIAEKVLDFYLRLKRKIW